MQNFELGEDMDLTVTLELEDGTSLECDVIVIFEIDEYEQDYVALYPTSGEPDEVYLMRCEYDGGDEMSIEEIDDDEEFDVVSETFDTIMEEDEWNNLMGEDD